LTWFNKIIKSGYLLECGDLGVQVAGYQPLQKLHLLLPIGEHHLLSTNNKSVTDRCIYISNKLNSKKSSRSSYFRQSTITIKEELQAYYN
jgi:hypothetical protein